MVPIIRVLSWVAHAVPHVLPVVPLRVHLPVPSAMSDYPSYHLPQQQDYAIVQERHRHKEALFTYGEATMFLLMWRNEDHLAGLVRRCPSCYTSYGKIAEAFEQPAIRDCPNCFGTTFDGGYKARIVREAMWSSSGEEHEEGRRGDTVTQTASVESTHDFVLRKGDYIFRVDGTRWYSRGPDPKRVITGYGPKLVGRHGIAYAYATINREDESSVAFLIPPPPPETVLALSTENVGPGTRTPIDYSAVEDIRGPLI